MPELYQYIINDIVDIKDWLDKNNFEVESFKKVIVESVEQVQLVTNLDEALKERLILKLRFFNKEYDFNVLRNKKDKFNIIILTEQDLPYKKQSYLVIETSDDINSYNYHNNSKFKIKKYICEPILESKSNNSNILSIPELLTFYRIYN